LSVAKKEPLISIIPSFLRRRESSNCKSFSG
jgi:hypothetical protein